MACSDNSPAWLSKSFSMVSVLWRLGSMGERERRNRVPDDELYIESEFLVYGHFHEDDDDLGFKATRWVQMSEIEQVDYGMKEAFDMLQTMLEGAKEHLIVERDGEASA